MSAQSEMIYEMYDTYRLFDLEEQYPAARTRFFLETVFYNSPQRFKDVLRDLVKSKGTEKFLKKNHLSLLTLCILSLNLMKRKLTLLQD